MTPAREWHLPPEAPRSLKVGRYVRRFLEHHDRLDGYMAFAATFWGALTLAFPAFWGAWEVTAELSQWTSGNPWVTSVSLLAAGVGSYVSRRFRLNWLRAASALLAFSTWAILAIIFGSVHPMFTPGVACYTLFALGKAISYFSFVIGLDPLPVGRRD